MSDLCRRSRSTRSRSHADRRGAPRCPSLAACPAELVAPGATFVTLERDGDLLGCVGTLERAPAARRSTSPSTRSRPRSTTRGCPADRVDDFPRCRSRSRCCRHRRPSTVDSYDELRARSAAGRRRDHGRGRARRRATLLPSVWPKVRDADEFLDALWVEGRAASRRRGPRASPCGATRPPRSVDPGPRPARCEPVQPRPLRRHDAHPSARSTSRACGATGSRSCARRWKPRASTCSCCAARTTSRTRPARASRPPTTCAPSWWRAVAVFERDDRLAAPLHRVPRGRAARAAATTTSTPRSRSRPPTARAELVGEAARAARSRSTTRRSRCGQALHGPRRRSTRASCSRPPSSRRRSTSSSASARRRRSTSGRCATCAPLAVPGAPRHRSLGRVPPRDRRARRDGEHRRSRVPGDAARRSPTVRYSVTGEPVFPLPTRPRELAAGDVLWVDTGINLNGYASDFGATWIVGGEPDDRARVAVRALARHRRPRARGRGRARPRADLVRAAAERNGARPWLSYFYLAHGIGTDSAEMPFVGTDLGDDVRRVDRARAGHGARVRTGDLGRRSRRPPLARRSSRSPTTATCACRPAPSSTGSARVTPATEIARGDGARRRRRRWCSDARRTRALVVGHDPPVARGTRAFAPGCVVVREPASVHVLANTDDAVPAGFPADQLYGITWNPEKLLGALAAIPGLATAQRASRRRHVADDAHDALARRVPDAEFVDAAPLLAELCAHARRRARRRRREPPPRSSRAGLAAMVARARDPASGRARCAGVCASRFAALGVTTPAFEAVAAPLDGEHVDVARRPSASLDADEHVVLRAGALRDGWEASLARTYLVGRPPSSRAAAPRAWDALVGGCRAGVDRRRAARARRGRVRRRPRRRAVGRRLRARRRDHVSRSRSPTRAASARTCLITHGDPSTDRRERASVHALRGCAARDSRRRRTGRRARRSRRRSPARGSASTNSTVRGFLYDAMRARQCSISSSAVDGARRRAARRSPSPLAPTCRRGRRSPRSRRRPDAPSGSSRPRPDRCSRPPTSACGVFGPMNVNVPSASKRPRSLVWCQPLRDRCAFSSGRFQ